VVDEYWARESSDPSETSTCVNTNGRRKLISLYRGLN